MDKTWDVRTNDGLDQDLTGKAVSFLGSFLPDGVDPVWSVEHFRWKLGEANPAGRGFMTVAVHAGDVIGVTTITRKRIWDGQSEVIAAEIGDTFSHPDFRQSPRKKHWAHLTDLLHYLEVNPDAIDSRDFLDKVYGKSRTATPEKTKIGRYKRVFNGHHYDLLERDNFDTIPEAYGYES